MAVVGLPVFALCRTWQLLSACSGTGQGSPRRRWWRRLPGHTVSKLSWPRLHPLLLCTFHVLGNDRAVNMICFVIYVSHLVGKIYKKKKTTTKQTKKKKRLSWFMSVTVCVGSFKKCLLPSQLNYYLFKVVICLLMLFLMAFWLLLIRVTFNFCIF